MQSVEPWSRALLLNMNESLMTDLKRNPDLRAAREFQIIGSWNALTNEIHTTLRTQTINANLKSL